MKILLKGFCGLVLFVCLTAWVSQAQSAYYTVDTPSFSEVIGDMLVTGSEGSPGVTGTGRNYTLLTLKPKGNATSVTDSNSVSLGDIWTFLADIQSVRTMVFGFDLNQPPTNGYIVIEALEAKIDDLPTYSLGANQVRVNQYMGPGSALGEAYFHIDLPFDFMTRYNAASTEELFISATLSNAAGGFEEYYLSVSEIGSANAGAAVPEPGTLMLAGIGALGILGLKKRSGKKVNQS
jgi:hypothetical protein